MKKIISLSIFCIALLTGFAGFANTHEFSGATAPSGTTSYCWGTASTGAFTSTLTGCQNGSSTGIINYQWNLNGSPMPGATGTFTPPAGSGDYVATLSVLNISMLSIGTYTLTATFTSPTATGCGAAPFTSAGTVLTIFAGITTTTSATPGSLCAGSTVTLNTTPSGGTSYTYSWSGPNSFSATTQNPSITSISTAASGIYSVTVTNVSGCINKGTAALAVKPLPTISGGSGMAICNGFSRILTASGGTTYSWSPATALSATTGTTVSANPTATTTYTVTGTTSGCSNTATVTVTVNAIPTISGGPDAVICNGSSTGLTASGGTTYTWSPATALSATTGASVTANPASTTTYTVTGTSGICNNTATVTVTVNALPTISGGSSVAICNGSSAGLTASGGTTYTWSPATALSATTGTSVTANPASTTTYTITGTASGCSNTATVAVTVNAIPTISGGSGIAICNGSSAGLTASGGTTYTWSPATALSATAGTTVSANPTATTTYTVTGTTSGCSNTAAVTVTVTALPAISGGSGAVICNGSSTGLTAGGGTTYTWSPATALSATTGASVTSNPAATTTYTVTGTATGCSNTATVTVTVNASPAVYAVTGGGSYCSGGAGVHIGLANSNTGINYTLYRGGTTLVTTVSGTGAALDLGLRTAANTFTVVAANATTGCTSNMSGSGVIVIIPAPNAYTLTGGGSYCSGGSGLHIGLSGSDAGTTYQLYNYSALVGSPFTGTGSALDFGIQTAAGVYSVIATNTTTGCTKTMTGSTSVTVAPLPAAFVVTGTGSYCAGGGGLTIGLAGTVTGTNYQLYRGATAVGSPVAGTGTTISFGLQTITGTYTVTATNTTLGCAGNMSGSVSINALPAAYTVTGGGSYCTGGSGAAIGLSASDAGVNYQLFSATSMTGSPVAGTGAAISFGSKTTASTYTIVATSAATGCTNNMSGSATVTINALPTVHTITGGGSYCPGTSGATVGINGSDPGTNYQLYNGTSATGSPIAGSGTAVSFGPQTATGPYTVVATNATTGCTNNMYGSASVATYPALTSYSVTGGGSYCAGGTGTTIGLSGTDPGTNYQLYNGASTVGSPTAGPGTGGAISYGLHTAAGTYTIIGTNVSTGCTATMTGSAVISINTLPSVYSVTGGGAYCSGSAGSTIGLANSATGISYQLYHSAIAMGTSISGTGSAISFALQTVVDTYAVVATNTATGCTDTMSGAAIVSSTPSPASASVTGGGSYCSGGTGVTVGLAGSCVGINYQLYNGTAVVDSAVSGVGFAFNFGSETSAGTYTVVATNPTNGCTTNMTGSAVVAVSALPTITGSTFTVAPAGVHSRTTLSASPSGGIWSSATPLVATVDSITGSVTGLALGSADINYTSPAGCIATQTVAVTPSGHRESNTETTTTTTSTEISIAAVPNPNNGTFTVKGSINSDNNEEVYLEVTNMLGQVVYKENITAQQGTINQSIQLDNSISNGMYLLTVHSKTENTTVHIVVKK